MKCDSTVTLNSKRKHHLFESAMNSIKARLPLLKETDGKAKCIKISTNHSSNLGGGGVLMLLSNTATTIGGLGISHLQASKVITQLICLKIQSI